MSINKSVDDFIDEVRNYVLSTMDIPENIRNIIFKPNHMNLKFSELPQGQKYQCTIVYAGLKEIKKFANSSKQNNWQHIFGEDEGKRLWEHFVCDCSRDIIKILTYLNIDQQGNLFANILYGKI